MNPPRVTAVVLNWCGEEHAAACLRSLLAGDYPALTILLVDNGSPDGSGARLHAAFPGVAYLQTGANLGYTGGNNQGIRWAMDGGADYVLVLNNDTVVEPAAVSRLVEAASCGQRVGAVAPKILYLAAPDRIWFGGGSISRVRGLGVHHRCGQRDDPAADERLEDITFVTGCCCLLSADAIRHARGFAEDFFAYVEDVELSVRLSQGGFRLVYQPAARVLHRVSPDRSAAPSPFQIRHRDRNRRRLARRHFGPLDRLRFTAWFYPTRLAWLAWYTGSGDWARAGAVWRGMTEA
jgi:GT2 family glycosyltransferase